MRQWVASLLPDCPARDDVICIAAELAANAVLHTASGLGGHFEVGISWLDSAVRVTVFDNGSPEGPRRAGRLMTETGRGLLIVQALALKTGVTGDARGRVSWADIPWNGGSITGRGLNGGLGAKD
ncbi:MAG: ATP-binding protein [Actinomycetota bacterium]|nr:ATP-binding protein [Actinomycetota bacterium]